MPRERFLVLGIYLSLILLGITLYTFLHEGGHALLGLLFSGKITSFSINFIDLSAHVGIDSEFTRLQQALISVAGISLPVIICLGSLLLPGKRKSTVFNDFRALFFLVTINTLLAWIAIPLLALAGKTVGDDSFNFLTYTHFPPLVVATGVLLVYLFSWILFFRQMGGPSFWTNRLHNFSIDLGLPAERRALISLAALGACILTVSAVLSILLPSQAFAPPPGFAQVVELDLSRQGPLEGSIYRFTLEESARVSLYFALHEIRGAPVNLRLTGPAGFQTVFLSMSDPNTHIGKATVKPQGEVLAKGDYEIQASFPACDGRVEVFVKIESTNGGKGE